MLNIILGIIGIGILLWVIKSIIKDAMSESLKSIENDLSSIQDYLKNIEANTDIKPIDRKL